MRITRLTLPILTLHYLIDKNEKYSCDSVFKYINDGTIFEKILATYGEKYKDVRMDGINLNSRSFPEDEKEVIEALQRLADAVVPEDFGVDDRENGLLFLAGMLNELIQGNAADITFK